MWASTAQCVKKMRTGAAGRRVSKTTASSLTRNSVQKFIYENDRDGQSSVGAVLSPGRLAGRVIGSDRFEQQFGHVDDF